MWRKVIESQNISLKESKSNNFIFWIIGVFISSFYIVSILLTIQNVSSFFQTYLFNCDWLIATSNNATNRLISESSIGVISSLISAIIGISIPISMYIITGLDSKYYLNSLTKDFIKEPVFKLLIILLISFTISIFYNLIWYNSYLIIYTLLIAISSILTFALYLNKIIQYSNSSSLRDNLIKELHNTSFKFLKYQEFKNKFYFEMLNKNQQLFGIINYEISFNNFLSAKLSLEKLFDNLEYILFDKKSTNEKRNQLIKLFLFVKEVKKEEITFLDEIQNSKLKDNAPKTKREVKYNEVKETKSYINEIFKNFYETWKLAYIKENNDIIYLIINNITSLFYKCVLKKDYDFINTNILFVFANLTRYSLNNRNKESEYSVPKVAFYWQNDMFSILADNIDNISDKFERIYNEYESYLWLNITLIISKEREDLWNEYFSVLFNGYRYDISTNVFMNHSNEFNLESNLSENYNILKDNIKNLNDFNDFYKWYTDVKIWNKELALSLETKQFNSVKIRLLKFNISGLNQILSTKQKNFLAALCAYALYKKNYNYIINFWEYKQPNDAISINGGNYLIQEYIFDILELFKYSKDSLPIKFYLENNHDINVYLYRYSCLLFLRSYFLPKFYIFQNYLDYKNIPNINKVKNQIDIWINLIKEFKNIVSFILKDKDLLVALKLNRKFSDKEQLPPEKLLSNLIELLENEKNHAVRGL